MSFDLLMYRERQEEPLSLQTVVKVFGEIPNVQVITPDSGGRRFLYHNKATGVYCVFDWNTEGEPDLDIPGPAISLNLNYLRPTFFALESLPIVVQIAHDLRLTVYNPQSDERLSGTQLSADKLIASWSDGNSMAVKAIRAQAKEKNAADPLDYCPREKLDYYWRYMNAKESIATAAHADNIGFAPMVVLCKDKVCEDVRLVATWGDCMPTVFPEVDYLIISTPREGLWRLIPKLKRKIVVLGYASFRDVKELLAASLIVRADPVNHYLYPQWPTLNETRKAVKALHLLPLSAMTAADINKLVDVPFD